MTDVRELIERAAQIAESHAYCGCNGKHGACMADDTPKAIAAEIRALTPSQASEDAVTVGAAAVVDIWMGGDKSWRSRLDDSEFLESADWQNAIELASAVVIAARLERPLPPPPVGAIARSRVG